MHSPPACGFLWSAVRAFHASCYRVCKPGFGIGRSAVGSWPHPASFGYGRAFPLALLFCHHLTKPVVCTFVYKCLYPDRTRVSFFPVPRCQLVPFRVLIFHESGSLYVQPRVRTSTTTCSYFCNHVFVQFETRVLAILSYVSCPIHAMSPYFQRNVMQFSVNPHPYAVKMSVLIP